MTTAPFAAIGSSMPTFEDEADVALSLTLRQQGMLAPYLSAFLFMPIVARCARSDGW